MDNSEILRTIATLNTRAVRAERIIARYEQELSVARRSLTQANHELEEIAKLAEILYETNQKLGTVTDYLLEEQIIKLGDQESKSFDTVFNMVLKQVEDKSKPDSGDVNSGTNSTSDYA
ncbi:uncharacterized protein N7496_006047 [Penicillium cataractarum]|uniref:Uncharacterized protein n=1 Tax=Penicillium cataractarum TaxID=2100454 RepID=A0A9W9V857_9EURO|nr:uncharacterized protein N7496_006047 [Penicillium cataractarum]KAJ5369955.1 hypothetical protein N7496_006047 [Penicillium cataractarum]